MVGQLTHSMAILRNVRVVASSLTVMTCRVRPQMGFCDGRGKSIAVKSCARFDHAMGRGR